MATIDQLIDAIARGEDDVITRQQVLDVGGSDRLIAVRVARGAWQPLQAGVYLVGSAPPTWDQRLRAAVRASGPDGRASHRSALVRWGMSGIASSPVEICAPHGDRPMPEGVIVHRSRREEPPVVLGGVATSGAERTLLEVGAVCPAIVVEKAAASAFRLGLSSPAKVDAYLQVHGGKGRRGVTKLRQALELYGDGGRAPGSDGEVAFLRELRRAGIEEPVRQLTIDLPDGSKATIDFAWPARRKAIEFVGWEVHSDPRVQDDDTWREDAIRQAGWDLRRFAPHSLRTRPTAVVAATLSFLGRELHRSGAKTSPKR